MIYSLIVSSLLAVASTDGGAFEPVVAGDPFSFCTGYKGDQEYFRYDMGDDHGYVRFAGSDVILKVPIQFAEKPEPYQNEDGSIDYIVTSVNPTFDNVQWISDDVVVQFYEIGLRHFEGGDESDSLTTYAVSMTGASLGEFDRVELKVECGL